MSEVNNIYVFLDCFSCFFWLSLFSSPYTVQLGFVYSSTGNFYFSSVAVIS